MNSNEIVVTFSTGATTATSPVALWQYDYGQILHIIGLNLPTSYEVQFCNYGDSTTVTSIGNADGVTIPDQFLRDGRNILAYIFLHAGEDDGETEYKITIPVLDRSEPTDIEPTPAQESTIGQLITELNSAVDEAESIAASIPTAIGTALEEAKASGEFDGPPGDDGISPTVTVTDITGGHRVTITDANGDHTFDVMDGESGGGGDVGTFYAAYGTTTSAEIEAAYQAGKTVFCVYNDSNDILFAPLYLRADSTAHAFAVQNQSDAKVFLCDNDTWSILFDASFYSKPSGGIPRSDLASAVNTSLGKADTAYQKPSGGIPASDLAYAVRTSLSKADTALQFAPVSSVNGQTGAVSLPIPSTASDVGAVAANQGSGNAGKFLVVGNDGVVAPVALATWQGGSY